MEHLKHQLIKGKKNKKYKKQVHVRKIPCRFYDQITEASTSSIIS